MIYARVRGMIRCRIMIVTASSGLLAEKALRISRELGADYHPRRGKPLEYLLGIAPQVFVVNNMRGLSYYERGKSEAFFHPNMAFQRIAGLKKGCRDNMAEACGLKAGASFFDGTLGLAADSLVASYSAGESGRVTAAEKSRTMYMLVKEGLSFYAGRHPEWREIIGRISVLNADNLDFMRGCAAQSFDTVYLDFMFGKPVASSDGIQVIRSIAAYDKLTAEHIREARRVARGRVVIKSDRDGLGELLAHGFAVENANRRKKFYYAVLEK